MLAFTVSQATVSRYMPTANRRPGQSWRTLFRNQAVAFRPDQDSEDASGGEYGSLHAWSYRDRLVRFAIAQIALIGARRGRCSGCPHSLPNAQRISLRSAQYDRGAWHRARRVSAMPGRSRGAAGEHRQVTVPTRSPPQDAQASVRPRSSATQAAPAFVTLSSLKTIDTPLLPLPPRLNSGFPSRGLGFEKGQSSEVAGTGSGLRVRVRKRGAAWIR
jgi:hypothetical protein